ncbi:argininosuccinate lyase [Bartonella schoenbuchensis R1]|uniref:Argininosuccinate lyase n=2 Tax=Bartonella schoenbuchensis TaxID=165694 RepID=A0A1S6XSI7_BARSR|nr:argininosuccinate lyase [Bartonella schoenbuchensis R1]CDP79315.1 argininosuccinate lyase [Bartonella schoenbuchensis]CDP79555.1 argininosuccinate lyase [Bartonella schoenbuchensis]
MTGIIGNLEVNKTLIKQAADSGYAVATDLVDWLVRKLGLFFREAHHITGHISGIGRKKEMPS